MNQLLSNFKIAVNESIYQKNPESSTLGKRIIQHSILLIDQIGFESFTFKKLGKAIQSNESSIYRYFENKHKLLIYLSNWYWAWLEYQLVIETHSIINPIDKLEKAIYIVTRSVVGDGNYDHIDLVILQRIMVHENPKSFLTKAVDKENQEGNFKVYKQLVFRIKEMISAVNINYKYPTSLASTIIETALHQKYLKNHFPNITNCQKENVTTQFLTELVCRTLEKEAH